MRLGRCFRSLALTQVILEPSDLNSSSYASMFYVSSSFFVSAAVAGRLARSPHRYRNRICRTRSRSVNGGAENVNAPEENTRPTRPPLPRIEHQPPHSPTPPWALAGPRPGPP